MITISITELRANLSKYFRLSKTERVIIHKGRDETFELVPRERMTKTELYFSKSENQEKVNKSISQKTEGKVTKLSASDTRKRLDI